MYVCIGELTHELTNSSKVMENDYLDQYFSNDALKPVSELPKNHTESQTSKSNSSLTKIGQCGGDLMSLITFSQADAETGAYCLLSTIIIIQFIILTMMGYCVLKRCPCCEKKRNKNLAKGNTSVTSPLISSTKSEILSGNYQSSDTTDKVRCYNSMHKENNIKMTNIKTCMSDDILAKCLNRRDWISNTRTPTKFKEIHNDYDVIQEALTGHDDRKMIEEFRQNSKKTESIHETKHKSDLTNIEMVHQVSYTSTIHPEHSSKRAVHKTRSGAKTSSDPCLQKECWSDSEKEMQCLSYQNRDLRLDSNFSNEKRGSIKVTHSARSIEKGIQAFFPNDSLDNILQKDIQYLEADVISNLSFSSSLGNRDYTVSDGSDPKDNLVKILSSIQSRNRTDGSCSEPSRKAKEEIEILHLSRTSIDSSSAESESECLRTFKTVQSKSFL